MKNHFNNNIIEAFVFHFFKRASQGTKLTGKEQIALRKWYQNIHIKNKKTHNDKKKTESNRRNEISELYHIINTRGIKPIYAKSHLNHKTLIHPLLFKTAVAALFVVVLGLVAHFLLGDVWSWQQPKQENWMSYSTGTQQTKKINLPDGSTVFLNNASELVYNATDFNQKERHVWLKEGEAFFDVQPNPNKNFIVHYQDSLQTIVLGTSFNIKAYRLLGEASVTVNTGKVLVKNGNEKLAYLIPNENLTFRKEQKPVKKIIKESADVASAWKNGKLAFSEAGFEEIAMRLKTRYQVDVSTEDINPEEITLNGIFEADATLEQVASTIAGVVGIRFRIENHQLIFHP